ncbi:MAG: hypothetical protein J7K69_00595, partial [Thermotogae bacterium]|nr:hypothetical protein [Thermotogota bacterium]
MQINLEIAKKLIGLTKKNNEKVTLLNGKVVDIKGNIVKITANNKLYVVVINNSKILKNSSIVNLIFSNRQVTTPRISQLSERGKYIEAKLLFESEIENFQNDKTTSQGPIIRNPSRVLSNIFNFMFSERNLVKVLSLLSPNQLETLVEDLREITEALVKTSDPKLEDFKRNLAEFIVRVGKNLPRFLSFPQKIRLAVLRIYLDLDERTESVDKNDKITKKTTGGNTNSEKITPNEKKIFSDETVETKRTEFSNEHIAKKITKNFTERGIMPTQRDERQLDESSDVIRPKKTQKVEDETLDMGKKSRSSKLPTKFTEPHSYKKEMNIKFPKKVKLISLTFPKNHKDSNFTSNPKSIENVINEKNEIKNLIKLLRFSLVSLKTKTSQKIVEHVETVSKERPKDVFHILPKKSDIHISHMNSSLKEAVGNDNHLPSKPQSFFKNSSKNQPHFARETQISMFKAIPSSQKEIFESFKPTLLKYLNEESLDKIFLLFEKLPSEIEMELERNQIPVDVEMKKEILRDSFETLVLEIEKRLMGKKTDLEKVKILLRNLAQKVLESQVTKKDE